MKIPEEILLLCKDVKVYNPVLYKAWPKPPSSFVGRSGETLESKMFNYVGVRGRWHKPLRVFEVFALLNPQFGWRNIYDVSFSRCNVKDGWIGSENGTLEEVAIKLELAGEKNVFEIPHKLVQELETKEEKSVGQDGAYFFMLSFKDLREKCKRIC